VGAGPARERQAELAGRIPETWFFRCPALRIRDAVQWWCLPGPLKPSMAAVSWPNSSLQAPPLPRSLCSGTATGQIHPLRESARPLNFPRSAGIGWARPGPCLARDGQSGPPPGRAYMDVLVACPGRAHPIPVRPLWREKFLESCRELRSLSRAGPAPTRAAHRPASPAGENPPREGAPRYRRGSSGSSASPSMVTPRRSPGPGRPAGPSTDPGRDGP
jgi:hypothetical protein